MPHLLLLLLAAAALAGCASGSVFGIVGDEDDLYTGTTTGYLDRSDTIELKNAKGNRCSGDFAYGVGLTGQGLISCDDGQRAVISFTGLSSMSGFGSGTSSTGRQVAFTCGLSREHSALHLGFKAAGATPAAPGAPPAAATRAGTGTGFYINRQGLKVDVARTFLESSGVPSRLPPVAATSASPTSVKGPARSLSSTASAKTSA